MLPFEAKLFNVLLFVPNFSLEFSLKPASVPPEWSCQGNQEPRCCCLYSNSSEYLFFLPTYWRQFLRRVIQTRVWSQAAREIQPPLFPGGGLWTGYPSLPVLVLSSVKVRSLENQSLQGVVRLNEKTGLAHRNCALYVLAVFLLLVVMMLSLFSSEASGRKDLCQ